MILSVWYQNKNGTKSLEAKAWMIMKLTIILMLFFTFQVSAKSNAQRVTIVRNNIHLSEVFKDIEQQTGFHFFYDKDLIQKTAPIDITLKGATLEQALSACLKGQQLTYSIIKNTVVIRKEKKLIPEIKLDKKIALPPPLQIQGRVVDKNGEPLQNVSVLIAGTKIGTTTDSEGRFRITATNNKNIVLEVSSVGYQTKTINVGKQTEIDITLEQDITGLSDVVVVGYGTQKRKDVTGAISSVSSKDFANVPVSNVSDALAGRISGLDITSLGGTPGSGSQILLRGHRSLTASNNPLMILDGMPFYGSIDDIDPNNIKTVDVLKDASSTAIYGSQGANGVIIITTQRGEIGPPKISLNAYVGGISRYGDIPFMNAIQYAEKAREGYRAVGGYPFSTTNAEYDSIVFDPIELESVNSGGNGLNFQNIVFQNGNQQRYQLNVKGGAKGIRYNIAGNYFEQEGIIPDDKIKRIGVRSNLDFNLSSKVTVGASLDFGYTEHSQKTIHNPGLNNSSDVLQEIFEGDPTGQMYNKDGTPRFALASDGLVLNPMDDYLYDSYRHIQKGWNGFANAYFQVKIVPKLTYRLNVGTTFNFTKIGESAGFYSLRTNLGLPIADIQDSISNFKIYESILTYDNAFNNDNHLTATLVQGFQSSRNESNSNAVQDYPYEPSRFYNIGTANQITSVGSNLSQWSESSFVGRIFYGYKSKYLMTLSLRADGASQFAPSHKWGYFPSAAFAWRVSEEGFMKGTSNWLSNLKLRLSYGVSGNKAINSYETEGSLERTSYSFGSNAGFGYRPATFANNELTWESTEVYNLGADFAILNNRISGSIELYNTNTYNLLLYRKLPITTGFNQVLQNIGKTNNKGWEISLHTINIDGANFRWNSNITAYSNHTKIVSLFNGTSDDIGDGWFIGQPINVFYDYKKIGIWQTGEKDASATYGEQPGQIKVLDVNNDGKINGNDRVILGNPEPNLILSLFNQFTYKAFSLTFLAYARLGGMISVTDFAPFSKKRYNSIYFDYWTPDNPTNGYPQPNQLYEGSGLYGSTLTYRDASYIMLNDVSLGYTIPKSTISRLHISNLDVYISGKNLLYWTKSELGKFNMKPDWTSGQVGTYPALKNYSYRCQYQLLIFKIK